MATVTVNITRANIYTIAEGISVIISQHNAGTPTYEQLWASPDEAKKLDIYYREAVSDLERRLMKWVKQTSGQFDLTADGTDYTLILKLSDYWPTRLEGLLNNKIQDYLVHGVTAGWLNDFDGLTVKQDYQAMSAQDVEDVISIICMRDYDFEKSARGVDKSKDTPGDTSAGARGTDTGKDTPVDTSAGARGTDTGKDTSSDMMTGFRNRDDVKKSGENDKPVMARESTIRHQDDTRIDNRRDYTDMSGTDMGYRKDDPLGQIYEREPSPPITRPMMGRGYTPQPKHPPVGPCPNDSDKIPVYPPKDPKNYQEPPTHAIPPKYADLLFNANGVGWSDDDKYDEEREERFINSHVCGDHNACDNGLFEPDDSQ